MRTGSGKSLSPENWRVDAMSIGAWPPVADDEVLTLPESSSASVPCDAIPVPTVPVVVAPTVAVAAVVVAAAVAAATAAATAADARRFAIVVCSEGMEDELGDSESVESELSGGLNLCGCGPPESLRTGGSDDGGTWGSELFRSGEWLNG